MGRVYVDSGDGPFAKRTQREVERQTRSDTLAERSAPRFPHGIVHDAPPDASPVTPLYPWMSSCDLRDGAVKQWARAGIGALKGKARACKPWRMLGGAALDRS